MEKMQDATLSHDKAEPEYDAQGLPCKENHPKAMTSSLLLGWK